MRLLQEQVRREHPTDRLYALLFEVDVSGTYVIRIAGSEEALTRLAEKYVAKRYRTRSGDVLDALRTSLRWDAPGDDKDGWYWGNQDDDAPLALLIQQAIEAELMTEYDEDMPVRLLCLEALKELDKDKAFGKGTARKQVLAGITCCEIGFDEEAVDELALCNPVSTIARVRKELAAASAIDALLVRRKRKKDGEK